LERLSEIETRISSFAQLQDVISVMRSMAATRIQQAQNALAAIRAYSDTIGASIAKSDSHLTPDWVARPRDGSPVHGLTGTAEQPRARPSYRPADREILLRATGAWRHRELRQRERPRVALTQSARQSIEGRLEELTSEQRQPRQEQIATELVEVISGAEAGAKSEA
jgi:F0F1-type ATP synthase gamma subunit